MNRPGPIWLLFTLCLAVALSGLGWITYTTLALDRAQAAAERQALIEENTRLALWRMDSAVLPILMAENTRPYYQYSAQYHLAPDASANLASALNSDQAANDLHAPLPSALNTMLATSPLAEKPVPYVKVYFQVDPRGDFISPQVPGMVNRTVVPIAAPLQAVGAVRGAPVVPPAHDSSSPSLVESQLKPLTAWANNLIDLQNWVAVDQLRKQSAAAPEADPAPEIASAAPEPPVMRGKGKPEIDASQSMRNNLEFRARRDSLNRAVQTPGFNNDQSGQQQAAFPNSFPNSVANLQPAAPNVPAANAPPAATNPPTVDQAMPPIHSQANLPLTPPAVVPARPDAPVAQPAEPQQEPIPQVISHRSSPLDNVYQTNCWFQPGAGTAQAQVGTMQPLWEKHRLLITRRVAVNGEEFMQGAWLDWPALQTKLLHDVADLLPNATLEPLEASAPAVSASAASAGGTSASVGAVGESSEHRLALLPVRLVPGAVAMTDSTGLTAVQQTLLVAWLGIALAALAVGALLHGVISLSERRAAFVSAVTHELRTPLTTFRMYTEMLEAGMVTDEAKRAKYLETMKAEAIRLGHLVENVLAYARLERSGSPSGVAQQARLETLAAGELLARMQERLSERAVQAGLTLELDIPETAGRVRADPGAVEQILFNLVDNACKYARPASGAPAQPIVIRAGLRKGRTVLQVRDHGPGVAVDQRARLFQPFSRSAEAAANSATRTPGVGLGLALSRRMARAMGGDLVWISSVTDGACFELILPQA